MVILGFPAKNVHIYVVHGRIGQGAYMQNRQRVRVNPISEALIREVRRVALLTDDAIMEALQLQRATDSSVNLHSEHDRVSKLIETANTARYKLIQLQPSGALSQAEVEQELFEHRQDRVVAQNRLRDIAQELAKEHAAKLQRSSTDHRVARRVLGRPEDRD